jgi:hypothetical protein
MKQTKKDILAIPKTIQATFFIIAAFAFLATIIHWTELLIQVYPNGMRLSQFSLLAFSEMLLPATLFTIVFAAYNTKAVRANRLFNASLLTTVGLGVLSIIGPIHFLYMHYFQVVGNHFTPIIPAVITLGLYVIFIYVLRRANSARILQVSVITIVALAFIIQATFGLGDLFIRHIGSKNIMNFLTHPTFIFNTMLPVIFFVAVYLKSGTLTKINRAFTSIVYTLIGIMAMNAATMIFMTSLRLASPAQDNFLSVHISGLQTLVAVVASLSIYGFLMRYVRREQKK